MKDFRGNETERSDENEMGENWERRNRREKKINVKEEGPVKTGYC